MPMDMYGLTKVGQRSYVVATGYRWYLTEDAYLCVFTHDDERCYPVFGMAKNTGLFGPVFEATVMGNKVTYAANWRNRQKKKPVGTSLVGQAHWPSCLEESLGSEDWTGYTKVFFFPLLLRIEDGKPCRILCGF